MILGEYPEYNNEEFHTYVINAFKKAVSLEREWSNEVLAGVSGITPDEMETYVKYRANKMAGMLGLAPIYPNVEGNPVRWVRAYEDNLNGTKTDFFEGRVKDYKKVSDVNGFDDL